MALPAAVVRGPYLQMGTPTSIVVKWRTDVMTNSVVAFGTNDAALDQSVTNLTVTNNHAVSLSGLEPLTKYYYSFGTAETTLAAGTNYFFITHPIAGPPKPTRVWALGDSGTEGTGQGNAPGVRDAYYRFAGARYTDVWLMLGDNAYFEGTDAQYQNAVFNTYPTMLRQSVLWSTIGNHETYGPVAGDKYAYHDIFTLPTAGEAGGLASGTENYYSFNYANIHFVCLDSELSDRSRTGAMLTWLQSDLAANTNDWLIAFWHSPPYTKGSHDSDNIADSGGRMFDMRTNAVQLLESYGVDLVLSGHSHNYERSFLIDGHYGVSSTLQPTMIKDSGSGRVDDTGAYRKATVGPSANQGAVYVVAGSSGWATYMNGHHPAMFFDKLVTGSMVLDVDGTKLEAKFLRETGVVDDYFTIVKGGPEAPFKFSAFKIKNQQVNAYWKSVAGKTYRVERTLSLDTPDWQTVSSNLTATGATATWTNAIPAGLTNGFYRVVEFTP